MPELTGTHSLVSPPAPSSGGAAPVRPARSSPDVRALPPFVSSAPPRSEGEAWLRRLFS